MCAACPGGGQVSATTAQLNHSGRKHQLLSQLGSKLAPGCSLALLGDSWSLRTPTGGGHVFDDVEQLLSSLETVHSGYWKGATTPTLTLYDVLFRSGG